MNTNTALRFEIAEETARTADMISGGDTAMMTSVASAMMTSVASAMMTSVASSMMTSVAASMMTSVASASMTSVAIDEQGVVDLGAKLAGLHSAAMTSVADI